MIALQILGYTLFLPLTSVVGDWVVRWFLKEAGAANTEKAAEGSAMAEKVGATIGFLERSLIVMGAAFGSWAIIAAVVALKTVARYKELDEQIKAEYFLIGSLASALWALLLAVALLFYDRYLGLQFVEAWPSGE